MRLLAPILTKACLAFQGAAIFKEDSLQLHVGNKLFLWSSDYRLKLLYFY